ncbi:transcriptional regulator [Niastella yeongjuensis]|uniref:Transcriptional regulator n=1 Tax=Niastella yeongjuensis TaxID=354355 RepID=A0A1V9F5D4_9BACT|nr:helix-turn-helix transcriptional regulator [Niastella yeongjuensis]OQP53477.1 transcriptional regulator [Niastella yeongjuensis]SEP11266.1 AraC-type DNA-binding protein [Niastella yeongjuensis]
MTQKKYVDIETIGEIHELWDCGKPRHPLVAVIDLTKYHFRGDRNGLSYRLNFYTIFCKKFNGVLRYGRSYYDFSEGSLMFTAPGQATTPTPAPSLEEGWALFFHPDLIHHSTLGQTIGQYSYFNYESNEALHVSEEEKLALYDCVRKIEQECGQNVDKHTKTLIQNNIELLLNYCSRFYDRQFYTRAKVNTDVVQAFEKLLKDHFAQDTLINSGLPGVKKFAEQLNLSPNYLSDLLQKFTGKTTQEHIHLHLINKAKALLWSTDKPVSEIAYMLGFENPPHFTRLFRQKTGYSPSDYRNLN